jgi:hypothetical protein
VSFKNSIFVTVNTTIQVGVITKVIYINVEHNMFQTLFGHHQVISVYLVAEFLFKYGSTFSSYSNNLWFVYSLALNHIGIKLIKLNLKLDKNLI